MAIARTGASGKYQEFSAVEIPEDCCLVFVPALVALLVRARDLNGEDLTKAQVTRIRDNAAVMVIGRADARSVAENRGYEDIDAAAVWSSWQAHVLRTRRGRD